MNCTPAEKQIEQNPNGVSNKGNSKLLEEVQLEAAEQATSIEEDKIVKFGKTLDKKVVSEENAADKTKEKEQPVSRKIIKKRIPIESDTVWLRTKFWNWSFIV